MYGPFSNLRGTRSDHDTAQRYRLDSAKFSATPSALSDDVAAASDLGGVASRKQLIPQRLRIEQQPLLQHHFPLAGTVCGRVRRSSVSFAEKAYVWNENGPLIEMSA